MVFIGSWTPWVICYRISGFCHVPLMAFNCPPAVNSSWNLLLAFSSLNCWVFSKTPRSPPHVGFLANWLKVLVYSVVRFWGSPSLWLSVFQNSPWHCELSPLTLQDAQAAAFCQTSIPGQGIYPQAKARVPRQPDRWQWSSKGGLPGRVLLLWSPSSVLNSCFNKIICPDFVVVFCSRFNPANLLLQYWKPVFLLHAFEKRCFKKT